MCPNRACFEISSPVLAGLSILQRNDWACLMFGGPLLRPFLWQQPCQACQLTSAEGAGVIPKMAPRQHTSAGSCARRPWPAHRSNHCVQVQQPCVPLVWSHHLDCTPHPPASTPAAGAVSLHLRPGCQAPASLNSSLALLPAHCGTQAAALQHAAQHCCLEAGAPAGAAACIWAKGWPHLSATRRFQPCQRQTFPRQRRDAPPERQKGPRCSP